jgi:hypothetical protein
MRDVPGGGVPMSAPTQPGDRMRASVTYDGTNKFKPLCSWQLWTGNLADMSGVQEDTVSALSNCGRRFTATWLSTG